MKISIWHNIMWARYKAVVFSALHREATARGDRVTVYQIAETELRRASLSPVDASWHEYPYLLMFERAYSEIPKQKLFWRLARQVWSDDADVTILSGYERPEVWLQVVILLLRRRRFAFFCDSTIFDKEQNLSKGLAKRVLFALADGVFCYGERAASYVAHYGTPREKIFIRKQAAALPHDYSAEAVLMSRIERAPSPSNPRYLYVGRLSEEKSLDKLLYAFAEVLKKIPQARLVIVGKGALEQELVSIAARLGVEKNVEFAGAKFDAALTDEYLSATCLVLPSYSEPWGLVVNESLSFGCPAIVSSRCGCVPELIIEGETGYSYSWESARDLVDRLLRAPERFKEVTSTARNCIEQVSGFTPLAAAQGILEGAAKICRREAYVSPEREVSTR